MWFFCFQFFVVEGVVQLAWTTHNKNYSMTGNWVSDLGAVASPWHRVMNVSFVVQGVLIAVGAVLVRGFFPVRYWAFLLLFVVSGAGILVVGLYPEDVDIKVHGLAALYFLLAGNLAMILLGLLRVLRSNGQVTLAAGVIGLGALRLLIYINANSGTPGNPGTLLAFYAGLVERFAIYPLQLWLTWTGWRMMKAVARRPMGTNDSLALDAE